MTDESVPSPTELWLGADGNVLPDRNGAVAVEINQVDQDGLIVQRTYATLEGGKPTTPFTDVEDEDQTQALSWDLWVEDADGALKPVDTLDEFWAAFELEDESGPELVSQVCHILQLPVWDVAPEKLRNEVHVWIRNTAHLLAASMIARAPTFAASAGNPQAGRPSADFSPSRPCTSGSRGALP